MFVVGLDMREGVERSTEANWTILVLWEVMKERGGRLACVAMLVLVRKCCALQVAHWKLLEVSVHTMIRWQLEHLHDQDSALT